MAPTFGASTTQQQRENARLEREREKLEKERLEREEQNQLTEEQREEIKEAVSPPPLSPPKNVRWSNVGFRTLRSERTLSEAGSSIVVLMFWECHLTVQSIRPR